MNIEEINVGVYSGKILSEYNTEYVRDFLKSIREVSERSEIIYDVRNKVIKVPFDFKGRDIIFCVKKFPKFNRLRSLYYRKTKSKAEKSFDSACHLKSHSVGVPDPVAFLEKWEKGLLLESYYIDIFQENISSFKKEMINILRNEKDCEKFLNLLKPVAIEFSKMHDSGFQHNDSGYQNVMMRRIGEKEWGDVSFIDLNRAVIKKELSLKERAKDIAKLEIPSDFLRIFLYMYFDDKPIPEEFSVHERKFRKKITFHNESRKYRHPIRYLKNRHIKEEDLNIRPDYKDMWLWDEKSGQPAVMLSGKDRRKFRKTFDIFKILYSNAKYYLSIYRKYRYNKAISFKNKSNIYPKIGVTLEVDLNIDKRLEFLYELSCRSVFIRVYYHKGRDHWEKVCELISFLHKKGYELSIGLIQDRECVRQPEKFKIFAGFILQRVFPYITYCEIAHAVNRVKWGIWSLSEYRDLISSIAELTARYDNIRFLLPAVNDFEFHFSVYCLDLFKNKMNFHGNSCHLYVDRRGAPENYQGKFSLLEKCALGKAISDVFNVKASGFYITEINWPLKGKGIYSPIGCPYVAPGITENPIHVDEEEYARYMIRTYLIALCSGMTERVWWWRLSAKGYGLVDDIDGFKPYKAFYALKTFLFFIKDRQFLYLNIDNEIIEYIFEGMIIRYSTQKDFSFDTVNKITDITGIPVEKNSTLKKGEIYYFFDI